MIILIILTSIFLITGTAWLVKRYLSINICPICAGVFLTWFILLALMLTGKISAFVFQMPIALLMGGSVVGIAYKLESKIKKNKSILLFKVLFILFGFGLAYSLVLFNLISIIIFTILLMSSVFSFLNFKNIDSKPNKDIDELIDKMKNCC
jgi:hypothetical protein